MNTLNNENIIYVPNTLDGENIVSSHLEENSLLVDGTNQMLANLNAGNHRLTHVSSAISANDAVNKSQLDLKSDTSYVDGNFLNKVTANTQTVNSNLDMNTKRIYNLSNPLTQTDAVNLSYLGTNYLNKTTTANSTIAAKVSFTNTIIDINNPVISMFNTVGGASNGNFLRFQKGVVENSNTEIGGLSACDKNIGNTLIRVADLIFSRGINGEARMDLKMIDGNRNPLRITDGEFTSKNNNQTFLKQDGTNLLNYTSANDKWIMYKPLDMNMTNKIINVASPTDNGDIVNKEFLDTNFLNKVTENTQVVESRLTFDNTTSGSSHPIINLQNAITGSNKGMYLQFFKDFVRVPDTEIGSIVFADKEAITLATNRAVELTASIDDNSNPLLNIKFDSGLFNPLTISNTQTILRTDAFYIKNKTTLENVFTYLNSTDKFTMSKPLDCVDFNSGGDQILGTNSSSSLNVKSSTFFEADVLIESNKHLAFYNSDLTAESGVKMYFDRSAGSLGRFYLDMRGSEIQIRTDSGSEPTSERVKINNNESVINNNLICNGNVTLGNNTTGDTTTINSISTFNGTTTFNSETTINNNLICNGNINLGNNTTGDTTTVNSVATFNGTTTFNDNTTFNSISTYNGTTTFNDDVLIDGTNKLSFNSDDLSSAKGMFMSYNGSVGFLDFRGNEFRVRTSSTGTPDTIRFKINDTNTSVINNFFVNGNTTLGDNVATDTTVFNSIANFPSGSELKFNSGSTLLLQSGSTTTFASGSNTGIEDGANLQYKANSSSYYLAGAYLEYANVQSFLTGSYIDSARVRLIPSGNSNLQLGNLNVENGMYCNNTSKITITMPNKNAYWNNRHYIIKILVEDVDFATPTGVSIDNNTNTIGVSTNYRSYQFAFTSDFSFTGKIFIIGDK
jgi:hypothetical protein